MTIRSLFQAPYGLVLRSGDCRLLFLRQISDQGLSGQDHRSNAGGILQSRACDFGRIDDTSINHIDILVSHDVVANILIALLLLSTTNTFNNNGTITATINDKLAQGLFKGTTQDEYTCCSITSHIQTIQSLDCIDKGHATTRDNTLFYTGTGR